MSELISNPTLVPEPEAVDSVHLPADTGPAESAPTKVVVRYRANADSSDSRDTLEEQADPNGPEIPSAPDRDFGAHRRRARALARVLASSLGTITKAGIHGALRYPRSTAVAALSLLILGAILRTQPDKPTPKAQIDQRPSAISSAEKKGTGENNEPASNVRPIVDNDVPLNTDTGKNPAKENGQPPASPPNSASSPLPPLPVDAVAQGQTQPPENPGTENGPVAGNAVPAPRLHTWPSRATPPF